MGLRDTGDLFDLTDDNLEPIWTQYRPYRAYIKLWLYLTVSNRYIYSVIHITRDPFWFRKNPKKSEWIVGNVNKLISYMLIFLLIFVGWIFFELSFLFLKWIWFWMSFLVWILVSVLNQNLINIDKPLLGSG